MTNKGKSVPVNGVPIREHREEQYGTQQRLADKCGVSVKTIQRAEKSEPIDPSVVNEIAKALNIDTSEILLNAEKNKTAVEEAPAQHEFLRLRKLSTAKELFDAAKSQILEFEFELELDENTANELAEFIEPMERLNQKTNDLEKTTPASEQLRVIGKVSSRLTSLAEKNICVFLGFTTYREQNVESFPTDADYEIYVSSITHKKKAVVQFGKCESKTSQALVYIGLTYQEAQFWLEKENRNRASNTKVDWGCYSEPNAFFSSTTDPDVVVIDSETVEFDNDIPM